LLVGVSKSEESLKFWPREYIGTSVPVARMKDPNTERIYATMIPS
jgi:hypothetical protein